MPTFPSLHFFSYKLPTTTILVLRLQIAPCCRLLTSGVDVASQMGCAQGCAFALKGGIFDLVVVNNVGFRRCVCPRVDVLFRCRAVSGNNTFNVDDFELTVLRLRT